MQQPVVKVGIMNEPAIRFRFSADYRQGDKIFSGEQHAEVCDGKVKWDGGVYDTVEFTPCDMANSYFEQIGRAHV